VARGIGISLVVLGHTIRGLVSAGLVSSTGPVHVVDQWIYAFHMPLFFVVAGFFLPRLAVRPFGGYVVGRLRRVGYPYLVWVPLQTLLQLAFASQINHAATLGQIGKAFYQPPLQFWFLYTLLLQSLLFGIWRWGGGGPWGFLGAAIAGWVGGAWLPDGVWAPAHSTIDMLPYLAIGALLGAAGDLRNVYRIPRGILGTIVILGFSTVTIGVRSGLEDSRWFRPVGALAGTAGSMAAALMIERGGVGRLLAEWGRRSLAIYVAHTIVSAAVRIGLQRGAHVTSVGVHLALGTVAGIVGPVLLDRIARRYRVPLFDLPGRRVPPTPAGTPLPLVRPDVEGGSLRAGGAVDGRPDPE
jgi:fucose 4-O-acetylase-like acetyltransferase